MRQQPKRGNYGRVEGFCQSTVTDLFLSIIKSSNLSSETWCRHLMRKKNKNKNHTMVILHKGSKRSDINQVMIGDFDQSKDF